MRPPKIYILSMPRLVGKYQWQKLYELQGGKCAICHRPLIERLTATDHNHETGRIRGLLCDSCNTKVGIIETAKRLDKTYWDWANS